MKDKGLQDIDYLDDDTDSQGFIDRGVQPTQSIDLKGLMAELDTLGETLSPDLEETPFGKLMEAVPIPVLLLDEGRRITFLNEAVGKISVKYRELKGKECASIFPDGKVGQQVESLVKTVCFNRQIQIIEAIIKIGDSKIWGRVHLQPLRWGSDTSVLMLIEDLTLEKSQLVLQKKMRKELEKRVEDRTADLARINERLQQEVGERKRAEAELITHRNDLEQLVVGRTRELNATIARMKQEVKERKKAESSLRASESRLQLAFNANPGAVSMVSLSDGKYLDVNATFCRFSGYAHDEIIGRTDDELKYWAHSGLRETMIQTLKETGKVNDFEAVFRTKSGKMKVGSLSAEIIELDKQPYILSVVMDITEQKRAERDHNLFAAAIDQVGESVLISDARGFMKYANSAFEAASGYSREEIRGQNIGIIRSTENDQNVLAQLNLSLKEGKPWQGRLVNRRRNGSYYEVETSVIPVSGKSSRAMNFVIVERDARSGASLDGQLGQAMKMQSIATMAAGIANELNDILAASMGYAFLAREKLEPDSPGRHDLDRLIKIGDRTADLAMRLLTFGGMVEEDRHLVDLHPVVHEALGILRHSLPSTVEIKCHIDSQAGLVLASPSQMHRLIMNLCANAVEAMQGSGGTLTVDVGRDVLDAGSPALRLADVRPGAYVKLTIRDTGQGMTDDVTERIFEPYFTTKQGSKASGMGLALVYGIVRGCNGGITVESQPGRGSTFTVYLPECQSGESPAVHRPEPLMRGTERILLVDDEEDSMTAQRRILESAGYHVTATTDPSEAIAAFRASSDGFDLVISDLAMPGMSGLELSAALMQVRPEARIVICAAFCEPFTVSKIRGSGIKDLLMKPVQPSVLCKAVRRALG